MPAHFSSASTTVLRADSAALAGSSLAAGRHGTLHACSYGIHDMAWAPAHGWHLHCRLQMPVLLGVLRCLRGLTSPPSLPRLLACLLVLQQWVRLRLKQAGLPVPEKVFMVSAAKGLGVRDMVEDIKEVGEGACARALAWATARPLMLQPRATAMHACLHECGALSQTAASTTRLLTEATV